MTPEEHQQRHIELHRGLDELLTCYFSENCRVAPGPQSGSIKAPIVDLLQWAYLKTQMPTPAESHENERFTSADLEGQRQMLLLALAELELERPGWNDAIRLIAKNFDDVGLPTFEALKAANSDRVFQSRGPHRPMIAQQDEPRIFAWLQQASDKGGGFISSIATAALSADYDNYPIVRPAILVLIERYPKYGI